MVDWDALGTWAAVVVALSISLRDTWERRRVRSARHLVMSAKILPAVLRLRDAVAATLAEAGMVPRDLNRVRGASDDFAARLNGMGLHHLKGQADEVDALPERMLIPLVKCIALSEMLLENHGLRRSVDEPAMLDDALIELEEWKEQARAIKASLEWVVEGATSHMTSRRWTHPERWG